MKLQQLIFAIIACFLVLSSFVIVMADSSDDFKDLHENCAAWANAGECQKNPDYMLYNCAKSCHQDIPDSFYNIQAEDIDGNMIDFKMFRDRVVYIVNVASEC